MYSKALLLALLPTAFGHIGLWHPSTYDFNGDGYTLVTPMSGLQFNQWWFHGNLGKKPTGAPMSLPAGGSVTVELACNKAYTSYGNQGDGRSACPTDVGSFHAGNPIDPNQILGCGLAIAYKSNANDVKPEDFAVFSINTNCVRDLKTVFSVPAKMPACPNGKCTCAWFWQGQSSANEMYMTGFDCNVTGATSSVAIGKPAPPKYCANGGCVGGAKQPLYWANSNPNVVFSGDYYQKPSYNPKWGFQNGAQNDIFTGGSSSPPPPPPPPTSGSPPGQQTSFISLTTTAPAAAVTCAWADHCKGATCASENDCSDSLVCSGGKCT